MARLFADLYDEGVVPSITHHREKGYLIDLCLKDGTTITLHVDFRVLDSLARQSVELRPTPSTIPGLEPAPELAADIDRARQGWIDPTLAPAEGF